MNAVIYGAGNIGRGFIGQLFYESGYKTTFIDINDEVLHNLNKVHQYPIKFAEKDRIAETIWIKDVSGVNGRDEELVASLISEADIMATAVGVNVLPYITENIARGIERRFKEENFEPLNIILCENMIGADKFMREIVYEKIDREYKPIFDKKIAFIEASVGRMVPVPSEETKKENPLLIITENYKYLPVDKDSFIGEIPEIKNMIPFAPFNFFIERKLYIHNQGHAAVAYLGKLAEYEYIWQAIENPYIEMISAKIMRQSAKALSLEYNIGFEKLDENINNLIYRFSNIALGDTLQRVGNDVKRKLSQNDRIIGAYSLFKKYNLSTEASCLLIAAAINFGDAKIGTVDAEEVLNLAEVCDIVASDIDVIKKYDKMIKEKATIQELYKTLKEEENRANNSI